MSSERSTLRCAGLTMLPSFGFSECSLPGPWQLSQAMFSSTHLPV